MPEAAPDPIELRLAEKEEKRQRKARRRTAELAEEIEAEVRSRKEGDGPSIEAQILARLTQLESVLDEMSARLLPLGSLQKHFRAMSIQVEALVRREFVGQLGTLPAPFGLTANRVPMLGSGTSDAGIILAALAQTGVGTRRFVDLGSGSTGGTTAFLSTELGFSGLLIDGSEIALERSGHVFASSGARPVHAFISRENVNELLASNGMIGDIDVFSIDIDGNDYWIWDAITVVEPRLVVAEYNWRFGPTEAVTIPYRADFNRKEHGLIQGYHGASLAALVGLASRKGYRLVACDPDGVNSFYIRDGLAPNIAAVEPALAYRVTRHPRGGEWEPPEPFFEKLRDAGLKLERVG